MPAPTLQAPTGASTVANRNYWFIGMFSAALYSVLLIAPVVGSKIGDQYSVGSTELGLLFSLELGAFSLATVPAYFWLRRANLKTASAIATVLVVSGNIASAYATSFEVLIGLRFVTALAAGSITVIILSVSGRTSNPGRAFGLFVVAQLAMGAAILAIFPALFASAEVGLVYWTLAVITAACLPSVATLDGTFMRASSHEAPSGLAVASIPPPRRGVVSFAAGLAAVLLFYLALSGVWTFMAQIATAAGSLHNSTSFALSVATVAGIASTLIATWIGETSHRRVILTGGYVAMAASVLLLLGGPPLAQFVIAAVVFKFAWTLLLPYLLSTLSALGSGGQVMNTVNLMIGGGFALGPVIAGTVIDSFGFGGMLIFSALCLAASFVFIAAATSGQRNVQ
ncbi:MFS transporter [Rhodococcus erythropolis]|uniref:MFS transporter n=1 Tax=Rhodococcus erythropolis TaxID=1833 RepID=UPI000878BA16|nr:MFS transporter [Rhodococcus erythropolis]OFV78626.1 major facilitator superfamily protein [Rhodococcus erythropolis]